MRRVILVSFFCIVVSIATVSPAQTLTTLYSFCAQNNCTDGFWPHAALVQGNDGNFYGTTQAGGTSDVGVIFKITPEGALTTFHNFSGPDGGDLFSGLTLASDGNFYGTTAYGGAHDDPSCEYGNIPGCGTVYKITPEGVLTTLYSFCAERNCYDGAEPETTLVQGRDGNLYGTASGQDGGTIFKITLDGVLTTLYHFCSLNNCVDGKWPVSLALAADGNFYGATNRGGAGRGCDDYENDLFGCGTVFKVTPGGALTTLHSFDSSDGCYPEVALAQGSDGNLYGSTSQGGPYGYCVGFSDRGGTIFKITPAGTLTTLYSFCSLSNCADGTGPYGALIQASDGNFYGTTNGGGSDLNYGTLFKITPSGALTTLYSFCALQNCADGILPYGALVQASDGNLYGTTYAGGIGDNGTVYRFDAGLFSMLSVINSGGGTITSIDRQIYCGSECSHAYANGTQITLSATPAPGYTLSGWTGCDKMNGSYCSVTMTSAKDVTASFTPAGVTLTSLTFKPSYVRGGQLSAGTLTLNGPAPQGGVTVSLSSDHAGVAHPPSFVFVPGGKSSIQFAVQTFPVKSSTTVTITATAGSSQISGTLNVGTSSLPPALR